MALNSRTRWLAGTGVASALVVGVAVAAWTWGQDAWWAAAVTWPLDEEEAAAVEACEDPGWIGLLRVLEQDLDAPCAADWFADAGKPHLTKRHLRRVRWLRGVAEDGERSPRARFRAASALLVGGHETLPGLAILTRGESLSAGRARLADAISEGRWPVEWADPDLRGDAALRVLAEDDVGVMHRAIARLRHEALFDDGDAAARARMADAGLDLVGLGGGVLEAALDRRDGGLSQYALPVSLHATVVNRGQVCRERAAAACLHLVADLLEDRIDAAERPARVAVRTPVPLWEVLHDRAPASVGVRADAVGAVAHWVGETEAAARPRRLLATVAGGESAHNGAAGDPAAVLRHHRGPPWTTALTALAIAEVADVEVAVAADGAGVWLTVGDEALRVQACGVRLPIAEGEDPGAAWPADAVLAQAALEAAAAATERSDVRRLTAFAARMDPLGAGPALAALTDDGGAELGASAAAVVAAGEAPVPSGAEDARATVGRWAAAHASDRLRCDAATP